MRGNGPKPQPPPIGCWSIPCLGRTGQSNVVAPTRGAEDSKARHARPAAWDGTHLLFLEKLAHDELFAAKTETDKKQAEQRGARSAYRTPRTAQAPQQRLRVAASTTIGLERCRLLARRAGAPRRLPAHFARRAAVAVAPGTPAPASNAGWLSQSSLGRASSSLAHEAPTSTELSLASRGAPIPPRLCQGKGCPAHPPVEWRGGCPAPPSAAPAGLQLGAGAEARRQPRSPLAPTLLPLAVISGARAPPRARKKARGWAARW